MKVPLQVITTTLPLNTVPFISPISTTFLFIATFLKYTVMLVELLEIILSPQIVHYVL